MIQTHNFGDCAECVFPAKEVLIFDDNRNQLRLIHTNCGEDLFNKNNFFLQEKDRIFYGTRDLVCIIVAVVVVVRPIIQNIGQRVGFSFNWFRFFFKIFDVVCMSGQEGQNRYFIRLTVKCEFVPFSSTTISVLCTSCSATGSPASATFGRRDAPDSYGFGFLSLKMTKKDISSQYSLFG